MFVVDAGAVLCTRLVTGSGHPTAELVYKLVAREDATGRMAEVAKAAAAKASVGGLKVAGRVLDGERRAAEELVVACTRWEQGLAELERAGARPLQVPLVRDGEIVEEHRGPGALEAARERHQASRAELPYAAWRLSEGEPGIPTRMMDVDLADDPDYVV